MPDDLFEPIEPISARPTQEEIDSAALAYPQFNSNYVWAGIRTDIRENINQRWLGVREYCERNFVTEFREVEKHSSKLWELNCRYLLRDKLSRPPRSSEPDVISDDFLIECVVPAPIGVPTPIYDGTPFDYPTDQISRRVTSALVDKLAQLERRAGNAASNLDYSSTPYVIGLGLTQSNYLSARHMNGMDIAEAILIGAGPLQITINADGSNGRMNIASQHAITTTSGMEIPTAYFQREVWNKVSAVMWTSDWFPEESDLKLFLNPNADIPLNPVNLGIDVEIISYTRDTEGYTRDQRLNQ